MKIEKALLILWIIFGFVFIQAVDSILYFVVHLIKFGTEYIGLAASTLIFLLPVITVLIYLITAVIVQRRVSAGSFLSKDLQTDFPKRQLLILFVFAIVVKLLTNGLSSIFAEWSSSNLNPQGDLNELLAVHSWFHMGIGIARWTSMILLTFLCLKKYREMN